VSLDPFSQRRLPELYDRFENLRASVDFARRVAWVGGLVTTFRDDELAILNAGHYLSPADIIALAAAGRPIVTQLEGLAG
jgi:hypothetical protein